MEGRLYMNMKKGYELRSKLSNITNSLRMYDKIAVIFLLCRQPYTGLKIMETIIEESNPIERNNIFYKWLRDQWIFTTEDWQDKLAELLTIIQNYKLAKTLGFNKEDLKERFLPKNNLKNFYISHIRKVLYNLCEDFTKDEYIRLLLSIKSEFPYDDDLKPDKLGLKYFEYMLLYWSEQKIINLDEEEAINLDILINRLKYLNIIKFVPDLEIVTEKFNGQLLRSKTVIKMKTKFPDYYKIIDEKNVGFCVIINEKNFSNSLFATRWGTEKDVQRLVEIFTTFGFDIRLHTDLTYESLVNTLVSYAKLVQENHSFFVLIILSHGSENAIYTSDSQPLDMDTIEMIFQAEICPNLIGKPKIFIVQSCQGQRWQKLLKPEESEIAVDAPLLTRNNRSIIAGPQKGDSMIAWSTVQGYASFRDKFNGSWYIEELCKELWKFGDITDLVEILTRVNNNLRSKVFNEQFMVPSLLLSLRAKIKFLHSKEYQAKGRKLMLERLIFEKYFKEFLRTNKSIDLSYFTGKE